MWDNQPLGLQYHVRAYNTFAVSTLSYIGQLESCPSTIDAHEKAALATATKGPPNWAVPRDL